MEGDVTNGKQQYTLYSFIEACVASSTYWGKTVYSHPFIE